MDTKALESFAQAARRQLQEQVAVKLEQVLTTDSAELRGKAEAITELQRQIADSSREAVVERVAYTWFNRFCALRYMDVNGFTRMGAVSPAAGFTQPEILQEAKQGYIDDALPVDKPAVDNLLQGRTAARDPQQEAYRLLLVATCNQYHESMPFLFERIADYTELLMPDDLLSTGSVLHQTREALTPAACESVEVIGWLYQFYISEKKEAVDAKVKKSGKVEVDELPAKTALYTKDWVVRYLVENSLGRLWLLNHPDSKLKEQMRYYVETGSAETTFIRVQSPEDLKVCDPAAGSGHILVYAFELLAAIYEEEGYSKREIPRLILEKNLVGLEIDERAAALAAFALMMKGRELDRRFLGRGVVPQIGVLRPVALSDAELETAVETLLPLLVEREETEPSQLTLLDDAPTQLRLTANGDTQRWRDALRHDLRLFEQADNVGSLLRPMLSAPELRLLRRREAQQGVQTDWLEQTRREKVQRALTQAEWLAQAYDVVVANPPYLGKAMNKALKDFTKKNYPDSKRDLFAMFIERGLELTVSSGYTAMVTMQSWMFLSSYEKLRKNLLEKTTIKSMVHMDNMVMGIAFGTAATVWQKAYTPDFKGHFSYVSYEDLTEEEVPKTFPIKNERLAMASAEDFKKIPGSPIAYWVSDNFRNIFTSSTLVNENADAIQGMITGNNNKYLRLWHEIQFPKIALRYENIENISLQDEYYIPYNKGGALRKWFGNNDYVVNWSNDGRDLVRSRTQNRQFYLKPCITWTFVSSSFFAARYCEKGFLWDVAGSSCFPYSEEAMVLVLGLMNSKVGKLILDVINPTLNYQVENILALPIHENLWNVSNDVARRINSLIPIARKDWNAIETSWDFKSPDLIHKDTQEENLSLVFNKTKKKWESATEQMRLIEKDINTMFIHSYRLQSELEPEVSISEVTLTRNPHYRYGGNKSEEELEALLRADTMREFISYAVGCMFGRYSLDKPGLILANQGETLDDYLRKVGLPASQVQFLPDADNVIPMLDGNWFNDDIVERFKRFLRVTFGDTHYEENVAFIEKSLGKDLRRYFLREFYPHHLKLYKKRPIYWLFSSPKGSFNALIYMHRYRPDTISVVLNDYLREFRTKLSAQKEHLQQVSISASASQRDKTAALREIGKLDKTLAELREYEDEILYPLATRQVSIDLDDGVKANYPKFGKALKKVAGLS